MLNILDMFLHLDGYIASAIAEYGTGIYAILFLVIFLETGLVIAPFLPGDSLIFIAGAFAATGALNIKILFALMTIAAILGDSVNYYLGSRIGAQALKGKISYVKKEQVAKAYNFYEKHGGKTIIIARFLPVIRTFAPFVAGIVGMKYRNFLFYNVAGALLWVSSLLAIGFLFGNVPLVKNNMEIMVIMIIGLSFLPALIASRKP